MNYEKLILCNIYLSAIKRNFVQELKSAKAKAWNIFCMDRSSGCTFRIPCASRIEKFQAPQIWRVLYELFMSANGCSIVLKVHQLNFFIFLEISLLTDANFHYMAIKSKTNFQNSLLYCVFSFLKIVDQRPDT